MAQILNLAFQGLLLVVAFIALSICVMIILPCAAYVLESVRKSKAGLNHERKCGDDLWR